MLFCFAMQTLALVMLLLRGNIPDWISFNLSNSLSIAGIILFFIGLEKYTGRKSSFLPNLILLLVFAAVHAWYTFKDPSLAARDLNIAIVWLIVFAQCIWLLLYRIPRSVSRLTRPVNLVCIAFCIVCIVRIVRFFVTGHRSEDYFNSGWFDTAVILINQVLLILLILSLEHMFSMHLLNDIKLEEEKFSKAFNTSSYGMAITRISDGRIIEINQGARRITGYSIEDVNNRSTCDINIWPAKEERDVFVENIIRHGKVYDKELQFLNKNQEKITVKISSEIITVNNEQCLLSSFDDITDRKKYIEELIKAKEKAEESDKLKTAFLHNISHEIRTPMNAIVGFSGLLGEPHMNDEDRASLIDGIQKSSNNLLSIITKIITISNIEAGIVKISPTETNINSKIRSLHSRFLPAASEKNLSLSYETTIEDENSVIITDSAKLDDILDNLIGNSVKFTKNGSIRFGYETDKDFIRFFVSDTGIGIPGNQCEKIFDRFYQVESDISRQYEGTGLGLSIVKSFVELLGGKIWMSSQSGQGSVFYFTLPVNFPSAIRPEEKNINVDSDRICLSDKTIIVAEDNEMNYFLIKAMLSNHEFNILHAWNGAEAVELCKNKPEVDLVLMDIKMPVMNGIEASRKIKRIRPDLPVIALTAYSPDINQIKIDEADYDAYILKPVSKDKLLTVIKSHLKLKTVSDAV